MVTAGLLPLFETREDKDRIRDQWTGIAPTMDQVSRKQKRIPAIQMVNLILKLPPEANHELMTRMDHRLGPAICPTLQGLRKWLDSTDEHFPTETLPYASCEGHPRPFTRFSEDDFFFFQRALEKGCDGDIQGIGDLVERAHRWGCAPHARSCSTRWPRSRSHAPAP